MLRELEIEIEEDDEDLGQNYNMPAGEHCEYDVDEYSDYGDEEEEEFGQELEEEDENVDLNNYKGIYFNEDPGRKFQDEVTGAHFRFDDMSNRLNKLKVLLCQVDSAGLKPKEDSGPISANK